MKSNGEAKPTGRSVFGRLREGQCPSPTIGTQPVHRHQPSKTHCRGDHRSSADFATQNRIAARRSPSYFPSGNPEIVPISGGRAMLAPTGMSVSIDFRIVREIATGLSALAMTGNWEGRAEPMGNFPLSTVNCQLTCGRLREGVAERSESSKQMIAGGNHTTSKKTLPYDWYAARPSAPTLENPL